jgi:glyoxylase-like metal-dependent hydrolase (beta-lactamase superfamily II)
MLARQAVGDVVRFSMARNVRLMSPYFTYCYWVDGLMVDTGCAHCAAEFGQSTADLPISQVASTHSHEDHIGNNAACQQSGAVIWAHSLALPYLADPRTLNLHPYRHIFWGTPLPSRGQPAGQVISTDHHDFQVLQTPGHSPDHICLYEAREGWLFTGDAYVGGKDKGLRAEFDIHGIIASLKLLASLPARRLFPGSGSVVDDPAEALARKIAYLEETGQKVRDLHARGRSVSQIRSALFGPEMLIRYVTLGNFSGANLVRSYLSDVGGNRVA